VRRGLTSARGSEVSLSLIRLGLEENKKDGSLAFEDWIGSFFPVIFPILIVSKKLFMSVAFGGTVTVGFGCRTIEGVERTGVLGSLAAFNLSSAKASIFPSFSRISLH